MISVLIVKLSSLGDVIHALPVVADIQAAWKARVDPKKLSMVQSGDFAKAAKAGQ